MEGSGDEGDEQQNGRLSSGDEREENERIRAGAHHHSPSHPEGVTDRDPLLVNGHPDNTRHVTGYDGRRSDGVATGRHSASLRNGGVASQSTPSPERHYTDSPARLFPARQDSRDAADPGRVTNGVGRRGRGVARGEPDVGEPDTGDDDLDPEPDLCDPEPDRQNGDDELRPGKSLVDGAGDTHPNKSSNHRLEYPQSETVQSQPNGGAVQRATYSKDFSGARTVERNHERHHVPIEEAVTKGLTLNETADVIGQHVAMDTNGREPEVMVTIRGNGTISMAPAGGDDRRLPQHKGSYVGPAERKGSEIEGAGDEFTGQKKRFEELRKKFNDPRGDSDGDADHNGLRQEGDEPRGSWHSHVPVHSTSDNVFETADRNGQSVEEGGSFVFGCCG